MAAGQLNNVLRHLRCVLQRKEGAGSRDADLLKHYVGEGDEAAFEALVRKHGPMVLGVCRRVLRDQHDAEDAFQATFLVLVSKASVIRSPATLGNWLYGVAYRTALHARRVATKRRAKEAAMPTRTETPEDSWAELLPVLDQELEQLPEKYRAVLVLCQLQGKSRREAALLLGCPVGTVASRLARGLALLAKRLTRHGLSISASALAVLLSQETASADVPTAVVSGTVQAASLFAAGTAAATGAISVKVAALTEGVLKAMLFTKLKVALAVVLMLAFGATATTVLNSGTAAGQQDQPALAEKPVERAAQEKKKEAARDTAFLGVELHYGKDGDAAAVKAAITAVEKIEGVKATARHVPETAGISAYIAVNRIHHTFPYSKFFRVLQTLKEAGVGRIQSVTDALPDMEVELLINKDKSYAELMRAVSAVEKIENLFVRFSFNTQAAEGISARVRPFGRHDRFLEVSGVLKKAGVGKVTLDDGPAQKSDAGKTAWGNEVGGLQAGLGFLPGPHRTYQHGETVTLVVRVRNAGKETVKFKYLKELFMAEPLAVEDSEGRPWPTSSGGISANPVEARYAKLREGNPVPVEVKLPPGKETVLYELKLKLSPGYPAYPLSLETLGASGKVSVHYWRLANPDIDATLSKVATGKLELEISPRKSEAKAR